MFKGSEEDTKPKKVKNPHLHVNDPSEYDSSDDRCKKALIRGDYEYWHYYCDGLDDRGWGCGYRTLQTLCSWIDHQRAEDKSNVSSRVPSLREIQKILVNCGDKDLSFNGSRDWIGSIEVSIVLDVIYNVSSRIVHVLSGKRLEEDFEKIVQHFINFGSPIMMGGDIDASSKGIFGTCTDKNGDKEFQ